MVLLPLGAAVVRKKVAAIITEYRQDSHADVIVGRLLEGYEYRGERRTPAVEVVTMYTDQVPANDMSRGMAAKHGVKICSTVAEAVRAGVDGVVLVGEHGNYPVNEKGQILYPRYELCKQVIDVFRKTGKVVPVFCDKHLSVDWEKAKWMYDQSRELKFPLLAGSSVTVAWRKPELELALETPVERAVVAAHGGKESYGFHALEVLQCMVERRRGGETGVAAVQCLEGPAVWEWTDRTLWAGKLLETALALQPGRKAGAARENVRQPIVFWIGYRDGVEAAVYILNGHIQGRSFAARIRGRAEPVGALFYGQSARPYSHFSPLVYYIEQMIRTGKTAYPVERTLLTTGVLAAAMDSSYRGHVRLETPWLAVRYRAPRKPVFTPGVPPGPQEG